MAERTQVPLKGSERAAARGAVALGRADPNEWLEVTVKVRRRAPLPEIVERPKQPMTREQVAKQFGATPESLDKVAKVFSDLGLQVVAVDPTTRSVKLAGTVETMETAFGVKLLRYKHERGNFRGRLGPVHIPVALDGIVEAVLGLDNRPVVKRRRSHLNHLALNAAQAETRPWFFPAELATLYAFPDGDGSGQSIGLIEFGGGYFTDDLAQFCKAARIAQPTEIVPISVDGTPSAQHDGAEGEVMLDIEVVAGICPKATVPVYFGAFTTKGWVDVLDTAIHDNQYQPQVLSISWGDSEDGGSWTPQAIAQVNETLKEAALLGITVCVASGDDGSDDQVGDGHAHVDFPASSPYVLAVGGTSLRRQGGQIIETAWKDGDGLRRDGGGSTGGGDSAVFDRPSWQAVDIASVNPGAKAGRCVPDVAANASANTGYFVVVDGQPNISGGTSAAAPLWAALIARINAGLPAGKRVGYLTPLLYGTGQDGATLGSAACRDIVEGDNITASVGGYEAQPGYDAVTGWGSPNGVALATKLPPLI